MGQIIAVLPASGGVGATSLAAALAVRACAAGRPAVAVDLDPWSGGLDVTFGIEQEPGWRWDQLREASGIVDGERLAARLPSVLGVPVLAMPTAAGVGGTDLQLDPVTWIARLPDVLAGLADAHAVTVADACRDERVLQVVAAEADAVVVVVGTRTPELAAAASVLPALQALGADPWVVLRGPGAGEVEDLVIDELDVEVVGMLGEDGKLAGEVAEGVPPGHRGRGAVVALADRLLLRLVTVAGELGRTA
jgi:MinD-like ATPase involved in chromosome partitioning or flagellar assembly